MDLDSMLHIVAAVQYSSGNRDNPQAVKDHVHRFASTICKNCNSEEILMLYQNKGHKNFRNDILPTYKGHRVPSPQIILWKDTILEAFKELGAYALNRVETDDAMSVLAEHIGYDKVLLITADKDMKQVPTSFYNPFKAKMVWEERWTSSTIFEANAFFWHQVLAGDPTDMPSEFCGIEGVGMITAAKMCDNQDTFGTIIQREYTKKYKQAGLSRASLTYKMVRLLRLSDLSGKSYANKESLEELHGLLEDKDRFIMGIKDEVAALFAKTNPKPEDLFK
jgi:5'-3' exonuclease